MSWRAADILDASPGSEIDPLEFIHAAMEWHFDPESGSRFWLERAARLDFDPRRDIKELADLRLLPDFSAELRDARIEDLIPRGYGSGARLLNVFESGGTTGAPKRVVQLDDWMVREQALFTRRLDAHPLPRGCNWLCVAPTGPHLVGDVMRRAATRHGGAAFTLDMDPRWVKKTIAAGKMDDVEKYLDHLVEQAEFVLRNQDVGVLATTPPILERFSRDDSLLSLINEKVAAVVWGGTHMDADTRDLFRTEVFPGKEFIGIYGNTMMLTALVERPGRTEHCVFDPAEPYVFLSVVDPAGDREVDHGERGQVVLHHVSRSMLIPNNRERDTAVRMRPVEGSISDAIADVEPAPRAGDAALIEGVY